MKLTPKNWKTFQHYKNRKPAWIKLHRALLDDFRFWCLPDASRALAPMLWLLASEYTDGVIDADPEELAFRLHTNLNDLLESLQPLLDAGLFELASAPLAGRKQIATLEREKETEIEIEVEKKRPAKSLLPDSWIPSPSHYDLAKERGLPTEAVSEAADEMRAWSLGNGEKRANWDWVFNNWLRRNAAKRSGNGYGGSRALQDDKLSASRAASRLAEKAERGEFSLGPRPGLLPATDGNNVVLLPKGRDAQS